MGLTHGFLVGVYAVLHVAAPLPYDTVSAQQMLDGAIQGTMNVIVQAEKAGIKRVVYTSSMVINLALRCKTNANQGTGHRHGKSQPKME